MSTTIKAEVQSDTLQKLANCRPLQAIAEMIWNGFDADADRIEVTIVRSTLEAVDEIWVSDNGHGIRFDEALDVFRKFGGSWKKEKRRSRKEHRMLHGQDGQGRYRAFSLGRLVTWESTTKVAPGSFSTITITGNSAKLTDFVVSEPEPSQSKATGTTVKIRNPTREFQVFDNPEEFADQLAVHFAASLREYPQVKIRFDGVDVDPRKFEDQYKEYALDPVTFEDGRVHGLTLVIIEWLLPSIERALYFCDENGFAFDKQSPGIHAPDFVFTAYIRSDGIRELEDKAAFAIGDAHPDLAKIIAAAKEGMRRHFVARRAELAKDLIDEWKQEDVYPYEGEPASPIELAERQVFDVVAKNVRDYLPRFDESDKKNKKFSLHLLRRAIETSPGDVQRIIQEVLELPKDKASDLAALLERTTLSAIIEASKVVADRLEFLRGLELLLYNPQSKAQLLERTQLHKILEEHTWIFGEEFALSVSDKSLNEVLATHLKVLGRDEGADLESEVTLPTGGGRGIVDLMLSRRIPQPQEERAEHLIVELKRPSQKINPKILQQTEDYALAVAKDERFAGTDTVWHFWAVSNDLTENARDKVSQSDRPFGLYFIKEHPRVEVWAMPWSRILRGCRARLEFFRSRLEYSVTDENAIAYLRSMHGKYLPEVLKGDGHS